MLADLRFEGKQEVLRLTKEYIQIYDRFVPFVKKMKANTQVSLADQKVFKKFAVDFEDCHQNLRTLHAEFECFMDYNDDEQNSLFEVSPEVISQAAELVMELPKLLTNTDAGKQFNLAVDSH